MVSIDPEDELYRRLHWSHIKDDGTVNSAAFKRDGIYPSEISVDVAKLTDPHTSVNRAKRAGFRLGKLRAEHPMNLGFEVVHLPEPGNPSHAHIKGKNDKKACKYLASKCEVIENVESVDPSATP